MNTTTNTLSIVETNHALAKAFTPSTPIENTKVPTKVNGVISSPTEVIATLRFSHTSWKLVTRLSKVMECTPSEALEILLRQLNLSEPLYCRAILSQNSYTDQENKETVRAIINAITEVHERRIEEKKQYKSQFVSQEARYAKAV
jgi:hypothetical protein